MLLSLVAAQRADGIDAVVGSLGDEGEAERPLEMECARRGIPCRKIRFSPAINVFAAARVLRKAEADGVDLLHTHGYKPDILFGMALRPLRRIPVIATVHGWSETRAWSKMAAYQALQRLSWRWIERVVAVADNSPAYRGAARNRTVTIENGIAPDTLASADPELRAHIEQHCHGRPCIGMIGRLSHEKGADVLLAAFSQLRAAGRDYALVLIGDGPECAGLEELVRSHGLEGEVLFTGYVDRASRLMACFDVLAMPSRTEGLPITLLEAMVAGVPVVASRVGQIPAVVENGACGTLIDPEDAGALATGLARLIEDKGQRDALVARAQARVSKDYGMSRVAARYTAQYSELVHPNIVSVRGA